MEDKFSMNLGQVRGWFKCITFIVHFISNLMPWLIWQGVPVHKLKVGDLDLEHHYLKHSCDDGSVLYLLYLIQQPIALCSSLTHGMWLVDEGTTFLKLFNFNLHSHMTLIFIVLNSTGLKEKIDIGKCENYEKSQIYRYKEEVSRINW